MEKINLLEIGNFAKSKHELYRILTVEGGMYLPPEKECSMTFISEICVGDKKVLYSKDVSVCIVPQVTGLRSDNILQYLLDNCRGADYLPHNFLDRIPNRSWMANLCNSIDTEGFREFISSKLQERGSKILEKQGFIMEVDPAVANIFADSKMVAVKGGRSNFLLRRAITRKAKLQAKVREIETKEILDSVPDLKKEIESLNIEILDQEMKLVRGKADRAILSDLYDKGYIDAEGNILK